MSRFRANLRILMVVVWLCKRMSFVLYAEIDPKVLRDEGEIYFQMVEEREKKFLCAILEIFVKFEIVLKPHTHTL